MRQSVYSARGELSRTRSTSKASLSVVHCRIAIVHQDDSTIWPRRPSDKSGIVEHLRGPEWLAPPFPHFNVFGGVVSAPQM